MKKITIFGLLIIICIGLFMWHSSTAPEQSLIDVSKSDPQKIVGMPIPTAVAGQMEYRSDPMHFSLLYPKELDIVTDNMEADAGHTIVFDQSAGNPRKSFQVYVSPFTGTQITKERFLADEPSGVIKDQKDIVIDGVRATLFTGHDETIGDTSEVWFIHNGFLYEVVTYKRLDSWLSGIMTTWKFI